VCVSHALSPLPTAVNRLTFLLCPEELSFCNSLYRTGPLFHSCWAFHLLHSEGKAGVRAAHCGAGKGSTATALHSMNFYYHCKYLLTAPVKNKEDGEDLLFSPPVKFAQWATQRQPWSQSEDHPEGVGLRYVWCFQELLVASC